MGTSVPATRQTSRTTISPRVSFPTIQPKAKRNAKTDAEREWYRRLISAIKWILVTCFGYLGYRNARFGRIEAHEAVIAFGRELLLLANEIAQRFGCQVLHMLTDSLWVKKVYPERSEGTGATDADHEMLVEQIECAMGLPLGLEGIYKWVALLASRVDELRAGHVPLRELGLTYHLSRDPDEYKSATLNAVVARQLQECGVELHPGESLQYVITDYEADLGYDRARAWDLAVGSTGYDVERYTELLLRAVETVLAPFGVSAEMLRDHLTRALPMPAMQKQIAAKPRRIGAVV